MLNLKFDVLVSLAATVTVAVCVPSRSCQAVISYVPGSRPEMVNLPSVPVTLKNGLVNTATQACIHGCTSHLIEKTDSAFGNDALASLTPAGMGLLNAGLIFGSAWTLWRMPSE